MRSHPAGWLAALQLLGAAALHAQSLIEPNPADQARAAVVRHLAVSEGGAFAAICVGEGAAGEARDPAPGLLRALAGRHPAVLPHSACSISIGGDTVRATGQPALVIGVQPAVVMGDVATVAASHHRHGRNAGSHACRLRRVDRVWTVERCTATRRA